MKRNASFREQLRRNAVALISLVIAITSLGYNTWRNEASESNRNQRLIAIEMLVMLGDLQRLTMDRHYGRDNDSAAILRAAWAKVLTIRDLSRVASGDVPESAQALHATWDDYHDSLGKDTEAVNAVIAALEALRGDIHDVLRSLE
tara:strand:+ start:236 stop:673 length:438 start_codon:yes stop_codon:yes gene_type:complete